jgi:ABC-type uncharacterized transport system permease subunit
MKRLRLLAAYVRSAFLTWLAWRSFAFTLVANQAVTPLIGLAVWSNALPGRGLTEYFVTILFVRLLTVSYENHTFSHRIYTGELADDLVRPHPVIFAPLGENLAIRAWHLLIGLPLLGAVLLFVRLHLEWANIGLALPALVLAAMLRFLFTYTLALSAFWTERADSVVRLGGILLFLLGGEAAPIALLPDGLQHWAAALPFRAMVGFPAEIATGQLTSPAILTGYLWQVLWLGALAAVAGLVWHKGIRRYTVVGG